MTKLTKHIDREIGNYIVRLAEDGISLREKGRRTWAGPFPYAALFQQPVAADTDRETDRQVDGYTVRVSPQGLLLREDGRQKWYGPLPFGLLFIQAVRMEVGLPGPRPANHNVSRGLLTTGR